MAVYSAEKVKPKKRGSKFLIFLGVLLLLLVGGGAAGAYYANTQLKITSINQVSCYWNYETFTTEKTSDKSKISVRITSGLTAQQIGKLLEDAGLISNADNFSCYLRKTGSGKNIQAGFYEIQMPISIEKLVAQLQSARVPTADISIPEGLRADEIADRIDAGISENNPLKSFSKEEFMNLITDKTYISTIAFAKGVSSLEGYIYPDTYTFAKEATTKQVLDTMLQNFDKKVVQNPAVAKSNIPLPQIVIYASLLEKEATSNPQERMTVADILERRVRDGWFLNVDAALLYQKKDWKADITVKDKATNSPYNTYIRKGLTPTAICNPGIETIIAVVTPSANDYWFYLHDANGIIHYAKTYGEHNANIAKYLQ